MSSTTSYHHSYRNSNSSSLEQSNKSSNHQSSPASASSSSSPPPPSLSASSSSSSSSTLSSSSPPNNRPLSRLTQPPPPLAQLPFVQAPIPLHLHLHPHQHHFHQQQQQQHYQCCHERRPALSLIHHYANNPPPITNNNNNKNNCDHFHYRPRALSASYTSYYSRQLQPQVVGHHHQQQQLQLQQQRNSVTLAPGSVSGRRRAAPVWQMSLPNDNDLIIDASGSSAIDYRLGRYFDSMNATRLPSTSNYRSISYKTAVLKPSTDSNIDANGLMKPVPRLPESVDTALPVIRPKRSDSLRSTDSRTTTASTASTLVPSTTTTAPIVPQPTTAAPATTTNVSPPSSLSQLSKKSSNGGPVRRVRFADEPPAEYTLDNCSEPDSRGATPTGQPIVIVTKRLGPTSGLPITTAATTAPTATTTAPATSSIMSLTINRVPPPYPGHRHSATMTATTTNEPQPPPQQPVVDWRPKPTATSTSGGGVDYADDGYDSVNQTPSEGSVNSTTSSSGLPQSASPDHQQLDSIEVVQSQPITRPPPYLGYSASPLISSSTTNSNYAYIKQPTRPQSYADYSPLPMSVAQPSSRHQSYSSTLNLMPSASSVSSSQSQYRWLPGRSPLGASSASLFTTTTPPTASHYSSSTLTTTRSSYSSSGYHNYTAAATSLPLARAPSFRQLAGPEPVCIVAEHEFSSLLDSLPLGNGLLSRPNHL